MKIYKASEITGVVQMIAKEFIPHSQWSYILDMANAIHDELYDTIQSIEQTRLSLIDECIELAWDCEAKGDTVMKLIRKLEALKKAREG